MTGGHPDEAFFSRYRLGLLRLPDGDGLGHLLRAWEHSPQRWEPVYEACRWLNHERLYQPSYALSRQALSLPPRSAGLFVQQAVFDYLLLFEHSISSYYVGKFRESFDAGQALLARPLPPQVAEAVRRNLAYPRQRLQEAGEPVP
jgi:hypothetical protein